MTDLHTIDLTKSVSPFGWRQKIYRGTWTYLVEPLVRWLPRWGSPLRINALRLFGAKIGPTCLIERGVTVLIPRNLELVGFVAVGRDVEFYNYALIKVGRMTVISQYSYLCTGSHDYRNPHMPLIWKPIEIGGQCWLAAEVFVAPNVVIGDGSVVAARSVVAKSLGPWGVYGGNPCKWIKARTLDQVS